MATTLHVDLTQTRLQRPTGLAALAARLGPATAGGEQGSPLASVGTVKCGCLQCTGGSTRTAATVAAATTGVVDYTDLIKKSGRKQVDALLAGGNRWFHTAGASGEVPSASARKTVSFSFIESSAGLNTMDANGFQTLDTTKRERVRDAFDVLSGLIDVTFEEVGSGGDLQFGSNAQASSAGYARYPNEGSQVFLANNVQGFSSSWDEGTYTWQVLLHETAHALGLKHPGAYNAGGGTTPGPYLPGSADHRGNTIMSYRDAKNMTRIAYDNGAFHKSQVVAGGFQAYDVEALQYLYGASTTTTAKTYTFEPGLAFSNTLWNPNVGSEINLSTHTAASVVDLRAGKQSSIDLVDPYADMPFTKEEYAKLTSGGKSIVSLIGKPTYTGANNLTLAAGSQFTRAVGGSAGDSLVANTIGGMVDGGGGDDNLFWSGGDLQAVGGTGTDTLMLRKVKGAAWTVAADGSSATLTKALDSSVLATVTLSGIESVRYWNGTALKATGVALYTAPPAAPSFSATA